MYSSNPKFYEIRNIKAPTVPSVNSFLVKYKNETLGLKNFDKKHGVFTVQFSNGTNQNSPRPLRVVAKDKNEALKLAVEMTQIKDIKNLQVSTSRAAYQLVRVPIVFLNGPHKGLTTTALIAKQHLIDQIGQYCDTTVGYITDIVKKFSK